MIGYDKFQGDEIGYRICAQDKVKREFFTKLSTDIESYWD
jgi:hypothetical protein